MTVNSIKICANSVVVSKSVRRFFYDFAIFRFNNFRGQMPDH